MCSCNKKALMYASITTFFLMISIAGIALAIIGATIYSTCEYNNLDWYQYDDYFTDICDLSQRNGTYYYSYNGNTIVVSPNVALTFGNTKCIIKKNTYSPMLLVTNPSCSSISVFECNKIKETQTNCIDDDTYTSYMFLILFWIPLIIGILGALCVYRLSAH